MRSIIACKVNIQYTIYNITYRGICYIFYIILDIDILNIK